MFGREVFAAGIHLASGEVVVPLGGIPRAPTLVWADNEAGYQVYLSDRYGFRNPDAVWDFERLSLAAIGDSFTFGAATTTVESFVGQLREAAPATVSLGRGGNGPLSELGTIAEYLPPYRPRLVLWFYFPNDLEQNLYVEKQNPILSRYLEPGFRQGLVDRPGELAETLRAAYLDRIRAAPNPALAATEGRGESAPWWARFKFESGPNPLNSLDILTLRRTRTVLGLIEGGGDWPVPDQTGFRAILDRAQVIVDEWEGTLVVVYLPRFGEIINDDRTKARYREAALAASREAGVLVIDLMDAFQHHPDPKSLFPTRRPGHYGAAGHRFVAEQVMDQLRAQGLWLEAE